MQLASRGGGGGGGGVIAPLDYCQYNQLPTDLSLFQTLYKVLTAYSVLIVIMVFYS